MIKYGTSGFRTHHSVILDISEKIGLALAQLVYYKKESFGIMITASHNHYEDNGVKIMDENGNMVTEDIERYLVQYVNDQFSNENMPYEPLIKIFNEDIQIIKNKNLKLHIGYDSRQSSPDICEKIIKGILRTNDQFPYIVHPLVTTPELHFIFSNSNYSYIQYLKNAVNLVQYPCIIDCANGIGAKRMLEFKNPCIRLINTSWTNPQSLNVQCSSDFVCTYKKLPSQSYSLTPNILRASLDGDADRVVFYYEKDTNLNLLNGDYIAALILTYLSKNLTSDTPLTIGYIYTGYTNNACVEYIQSLNFSKNINIFTDCAATGVKNLHYEAVKYDIGVYFEQNGHGNVIFKEDVKNLDHIKSLFHPNIGDGILDLLGVLYMLNNLEINHEDWYSFFKPYPSILSKQKVQDKNIFESSRDELTLFEPRDLQNYIDELCIEKYRAFVRASGTENVVRIYVEGQEDKKVQEIHKNISNFIEKNMQKEFFTVKDHSFSIRFINEQDIDDDYYSLLGQLTEIKIESMEIQRTKDFINELNENHCIYVIECESTNEIIASGTLFIENKLIRNYGKVGHIEDIVVDKSWRRYGLGKYMIDHLGKESKKKGCYKCILECSDENVGFYEKCSYVRKGAQMSLYF